MQLFLADGGVISACVLQPLGAADGAFCAADATHELRSVDASARSLGSHPLG